MAAHNDVGRFGEALTRALLAQIAPVEVGKAADLRFLDVEIEVKTARPTLYNGVNPGYQFKLFEVGKTDYRKAAVLVLICLDEANQPIASYVIPTAHLRPRRKLTIPRNLSTRLEMYRERWDIIADVQQGETWKLN